MISQNYLAHKLMAKHTELNLHHCQFNMSAIKDLLFGDE